MNNAEYHLNELRNIIDNVEFRRTDANIKRMRQSIKDLSEDNRRLEIKLEKLLKSKLTILEGE